jgi:hypothetical protein
MKDHQLRIYKIEDGHLDSWIEAWKAEVIPLRYANGFEILGAWKNEADSEFVWLVAAGDDDVAFEDVDAAYHETRAAHAFQNDPAQFTESQEIRMVTPVDLRGTVAAP